MLEGLSDRVAERLKTAVQGQRPDLRVQETGRVTRIGHGIARIAGLASIGSEELVRFDGGMLGLAVDLGVNEVAVLLLGDHRQLGAGAQVRATGREADVPVGDALLGRVIDATGRPLDGGPPLPDGPRLPIERQAPAIIHRAPVTVPLETGIKAIDALIPIGRGQRELIVGDRQTGKTAIAVDSIINQTDKGVVCVYCAVGQRGTAVARVVETLRRHGALTNTVVVVAADDDPPGLRYITPYAAMTIAEQFMEQGRDALIVHDDLTRHARAYRELSLLLRRPPGREAYPGDIFHLHSRLLERATRLRPDQGGGSLTALPIIETQAQDISAYIPTNLISITDGQVYLSPDLFNKGVLPAIDIGRSVSRVGGKAQFPAFRSVAGDLRLAYAQFEELETFARFATRLDPDTRRTIERGRRVREALKQPEQQPLPACEQIALLKAVDAGLLDELPVARMRVAEQTITAALREQQPDLSRHLDQGKALTDRETQDLLDTASDAVNGLDG